MSRRDGTDRARQAANVLGALAQIAVPVLTGEEISRVAGQGPPSLVAPANYAFVIWAPITLLSMAYAAYQALPSRRADPLLRRSGWLTAGTFWLNSLWESVVPLRQILLAEVTIAGMLACLAVAYLRITRSGRRVVGPADRWLVALPVGLYFGWITAANAVSLVTTLVYLGVLKAGGVAEASVGAASLLLGGLLATAVLRATNPHPPHAPLTYAGAVLWALAAVIVAQYDASLPTTIAAAISSALVLWTLVYATLQQE